MRKHISFTIAATIVGLAPVFWFKASVVEDKCRRCSGRRLTCRQTRTFRSGYCEQLTRDKRCHIDLSGEQFVSRCLGNEREHLPIS